MPGIFPTPTGNGVVLAGDPADFLKMLLGAVPAHGKHVPMPAFASRLRVRQIADLAKCLHSSWGNAAPPNTSAAMVAKLRRPGP